MEGVNNGSTEFNKNEKQLFFNRIKGSISEINVGEEWCSFTLNVGHENPRLVNLSLKRGQYDKVTEYKIGDKVDIKFFLDRKSTRLNSSH